MSTDIPLSPLTLVEDKSWKWIWLSNNSKASDLIFNSNVTINFLSTASFTSLGEAQDYLLSLSQSEIEQLQDQSTEELFRVFDWSEFSHNPEILSDIFDHYDNHEEPIPAQDWSFLSHNPTLSHIPFYN